MPYQVEWTANALTQVQEHADFLASRSTRAATRLVHRLFDRVAALASHPRAAPVWLRTDNPDLRRLTVDDYVIIYLVDDARQQVSVLSVRHSAQRPIEPDDLG